MTNKTVDPVQEHEVTADSIREVSTALISLMAIIDNDEGVMMPFASNEPWLHELRGATLRAGELLSRPEPKQRLREQTLKIVREALDYYADRSNYPAVGYMSFDKARQALSALKHETGGVRD